MRRGGVIAETRDLEIGYMRKKTISVVKDLSLRARRGELVALIGRNGTGKTTLFRAITGELAPEGGSVFLPKNTKIGQVAQEAPATEQSLLEIVLDADSERTALLAEAETATCLLYTSPSPRAS